MPPHDRHGPARVPPVPTYPRRDPEPGTAADDPAVIALATALGEEPAFVSRTLRSFVRDGRLEAIPARDRKRRVILRWLRDRAFPGDGTWAERELDARLALIHPDVSALRRYLVDAGLLARGGGVYRRGAG